MIEEVPELVIEGVTELVIEGLTETEAVIDGLMVDVTEEV